MRFIRARNQITLFVLTLLLPVLVLQFAAFAQNLDKAEFSVTSPHLPFMESTAPFRINGGGSDGGSYRFRYTAIPHFVRNKKALINFLKNTPVEIFEALGRDFGIQIKRDRLVRIIETMQAFPARNVSQMNPEGIEEPLNMAYDEKEDKIYAFQPFFEIFNKKTLTESEDEEMRLMIVHEASHLFKLGINSDDPVSEKFAKAFIERVVRPYDGSCGLFGSLAERFDACRKFQIATWKFMSYSPKQGVLYFDEVNGRWVGTGMVPWNSELQTIAQVCEKQSVKFNVKVGLPEPAELATLFKEEPDLRKYLGAEDLYWRFLREGSFPRAWKYSKPDDECFATSDPLQLVCKGGYIKKSKPEQVETYGVICTGRADYAGGNSSLRELPLQAK